MLKYFPIAFVAYLVTPFSRTNGINMFKYGGGQWDFPFCGFGYFLDRFSIFVPKDLGFSVLVFIVVCRFSVF